MLGRVPVGGIENRRTVTLAQAIAALTSLTLNLDETNQTGSPVNSWAAQSGTADVSPMEQSSATLKPTVSTINSLAAPLWDGSNDLLSGHTNHMNAVLSVSAYYVAVVIKAGTISATDATDPRNNHAVFSDASGFLWMTLLDIAGTKYMAAGHRDSGNKWVYCVLPNPTNAHLLEMWFDGSNIYAAVDKVQGAGVAGLHVSPVAAANCGGMTATGCRMGVCLSAYYGGNIGQFVGAQNAQNATQRLNLENALITKWGI